MTLVLRLLAGPSPALKSYAALVPGIAVFALRREAAILVLPLTETVHERLHAAYGTGEWIELVAAGSAAFLTSTDVAFAARASLGTALAWIESTGGAADGPQMAAAWVDGAMQLRPHALAAAAGRPVALRPINAALRTIGVRANGAGSDERAAIGLDRYSSTQQILAEAHPVTV